MVCFLWSGGLLEVLPLKVIMKVTTLCKVKHSQPVGGPPDTSVGLPDGVDHAGVEECQEEDGNGVEKEETELVDWVALIQYIEKPSRPIISVCCQTLG